MEWRLFQKDRIAEDRMKLTKANNKFILMIIIERISVFPQVMSAYLRNSKLYKPSGFSPLAVVCVTVLGCAITGLVITNDGSVRLFLMWVIGGCLVMCFGIYVILLIYNPKELHSEFYLLEDKRLDLIGQQGDEARLPEDATIVHEPKSLKN